MSKQESESMFKLSEGIEEYFLSNELQVILKPSKTSSSVSTWIFYRVGSRNERPGVTGASHWCEHMLFKGGGKLAKGDVFNLISTEGGRNNAFTDHDLTAYYETLPKNRLDLGLFIESERMANSAFDPAEVESERHVVISEREGAENQPPYLLREEVYATAYHVHPYTWPVVGWKSDLQTMTRDDLYQHYTKYYHPNNATLVVTGNFEIDYAKSRIDALFSRIKEGNKPPRNVPFPEPEQKGERTTRIVAPGTLNYLAIAYHIPETIHKDTPALLVLSAVLGGWRGLIGFFGERFVPKTNRLYRSLVEGKIATEVNTYFQVSVDPGLLYFELPLLPSTKLEDAKRTFFSEIEKAKDASPTPDELRIAFNQIRSWHAYENDGVTLQALSLGFMEVIKKKDLADTLVNQALSTSPEDVQRVATKYFSERNRTVGEYVCEGQ